MKSTRSLDLLAVAATVIIALAITSPSFAQRGASGPAGAGRGCCGGGCNTHFAQIEKGTLSDAEISGLIFMREEEKMARDVYTALSDTWQLPIFGNIASAEQRHVDAVEMVFTTYEAEIDDPGFDDTVGVFADAKLAKLYLQLVEQGNSSLVEALKVGATIEDLDLKDLEDLLAETENDHVKLVYDNLAKGSRNHIRSFMRVLTSRGGTYSPDHIDQTAFDAILDSGRERRMVSGADWEVLAAVGQGRGGKGRGYGYGRGNRVCDGSGPRRGNLTGDDNSR